MRTPAPTATCETCGKAYKIYGTKARSMQHHFCSRSCAHAYMSLRFTQMNAELNPHRMTPETRLKLREARLNSGEGKTYAKTYGRHTHRVMAEKKLGRPLLPGEVVHHIDGNKRNNNPDNLAIMTQAEHARLHAILKCHGI